MIKLLESGECRHGHPINSMDDIYLHRQGKDRSPAYQCRECERIRNKAYKAGKPTPFKRMNMVERGSCGKGHPVQSTADWFPRKDGAAVCRACCSEYESSRRKNTASYRSSDVMRDFSVVSTFTHIEPTKRYIVLGCYHENIFPAPYPKGKDIVYRTKCADWKSVVSWGHKVRAAPQSGG